MLDRARLWEAIDDIGRRNGAQDIEITIAQADAQEARRLLRAGKRGT